MADRLDGVYFSPQRDDHKIVFRFKGKGPWERFETFQPYNIRRAIEVSFDLVEEYRPGSLDRAAQLDDYEFQNNAQRKRRYIAKEKDVLYIDSPYLAKRAVASVRQYFVITNVSWGRTYEILRLCCDGAEVPLQPIGRLKF